MLKQVEEEYLKVLRNHIEKIDDLYFRLKDLETNRELTKEEKWFKNFLWQKGQEVLGEIQLLKKRFSTAP